jgi:hypothetical protein
MPSSLTAAERETVIIFNDLDDVAHVATHQRTVLTKLRRNPAAREIRDMTHGPTAGAEFELPKALISFRTGRRTGRPLTEDERQALAARLRSVTPVVSAVARESGVTAEIAS